eukprot:4367011-Pleurochrysis_carterae.AAC.2
MRVAPQPESTVQDKDHERIERLDDSTQGLVPTPHALNFVHKAEHDDNGSPRVDSVPGGDNRVSALLCDAPARPPIMISNGHAGGCSAVGDDAHKDTPGSELRTREQGYLRDKGPGGQHSGSINLVRDRGRERRPSCFEHANALQADHSDHRGPTRTSEASVASACKPDDNAQWTRRHRIMNKMWLPLQLRRQLSDRQVTTAAALPLPLPGGGLRRSASVRSVGAEERRASGRASGRASARARLEAEREHQQMVSKLMIRQPSLSSPLKRSASSALFASLLSDHQKTSSGRCSGHSSRNSAFSSGSPPRPKPARSGPFAPLHASCSWLVGRASLPQTAPAVLVHHGSPLVSAWTFLVCVGALVTLGSLPLEIAFGNVAGHSGLCAAETTLDALFLLDVCLTCVTSKYDSKQDAITTSPQRLASEYARSWMAVDLLANVPYDWMVPVSAGCSFRCGCVSDHSSGVIGQP